MDNPRELSVPSEAFRVPDHLTEVHPWHMHMPFAFMLMKILRPRTVVELGVHKGDSYCTWCEAATDRTDDVRVFGIDTWEGDKHAGEFDEHILDQLKAYHDPRYDRFSQLIQAYFDDALSHFDDGFIDLLHIDGLHTYEAVRHDFDSWLPKVSSRGVVLFHDTTVRQGDFGVWRLWAELRERYPAREFTFGNGLGVLGVGDDLHDEVQTFFEAPDDQWRHLHEVLEVAGDRVRITGQIRVLNTFAEELGVLVGLTPVETARRMHGQDCDEINRVAAERNEITERLNRRIKFLSAELQTVNAELEKRGQAAERDLEEVRADAHGHRARVLELLDEVESAHRELAQARRTNHEMARSLSWRITAPLRKLRNRGKGAQPEGVIVQSAREASGESTVDTASSSEGSTSKEDGHTGLNAYELWLRAFPDDVDESAPLDEGPLISVVMPVYNPPVDALRAAIRSVKDQAYPRWELCIANDASTDRAVVSLLDQEAASDRRIRVVHRETNGHISAASNSALEVAAGEWIALLDHDDLLTPDALGVMAETINRHPDAVLIYSDEDKIDDDGRRFDPFFKPPLNRTLLWGQNYICHLSVFRREAVDAVEGFREGFEGSQDHDLVLRVVEGATDEQVVHIPKILYHWRTVPGSTSTGATEKPYGIDAAARAISEHLERSNIRGDVRFNAETSYHEVVLDPPEDPPLVSIIIPTHNQWTLLYQCLESIEAHTEYARREVIVMDNRSDDPDALSYFAELDRQEGYRVIRFDEPFNFSRINNEAVEHAKGELLLFLNNDTEAVTDDWLTAMVAWAGLPGVGTVGARLLYPDHALQHGGILLGIGGVAGHEHKGIEPTDSGYMGRAVLSHEVDGNTAACVMVPRDVFERIGGFDETLAVAFNDVDLCLKVSAEGLRNVWVPQVTLIHHESRSRGYEDTPEKQMRFKGECDRMIERWGDALTADRHYNPNLTHDHEDFSLASPPRARHPRAGGTGALAAAAGKSL